MTLSRPIRLLLAAALAGCASGGGAPATPATVTGGAPAAAAAPATPNATTSSAVALIGDWTWAATLGDSSMRGTWRMSYANDRWTGVVFRDDMPPSPLQSMRVTGRDFQFMVEWAGVEYRVRGRLETERTITGQMSRTGAVGRMSASKR